MALHTPDFGFNYFGAGVPGSITDEGGKYSLGDRLLLSHILKALEGHNHKGGAKLADPTGPAALALDTVSGQLPGGLNVYYRVSYVDQFHLETAASDEAVQVMPTPLSVPVFPILSGAPLDPLSTAPGLGAGTYSYALTALAGPGQTPIGAPAQLSIDGLTTTVVVTFPPPQVDQDNWGVWRMGPGQSLWTLVAEVDVSTLTFTDDGSVPDDPDAADPSHQPPTTNLTEATNAITISVPDPTVVAGTDVIAWRIYRTFASGSYAASSLLAEVSSTVGSGGTGGLVTDFIDDGTIPLQPGQPLDVSQCLIPSVAIADGGGGGGIGAVLFGDGTNVWRLVTDSFGALVTRLSPGGVVDGNDTWLMSDPGGVAYKVTVDTSGVLTTTTGMPAGTDVVYLAKHGPMLPSPDPTVSYLLGVADDGALTTVEV